MYVKIINPKTDGKTEYNNAGSCSAVVNYLNKEDMGKGLEKEFFFSHDKDEVLSIDVIRSIDNNCPLIGKKEAKFYSLVVAPRPDEMDHIGNDKARLKQYVRDTMDIYAKNFNKKDGTSKNLTGADLVYFAKLEDNRYYKNADEAVKQGKAKKGDVLPGDNTHVHIIVSRQDKSRTTKLSPLANSKKLFSRENFKMKSCKHFDENYLYKGSGKELERHIVIRDGSVQQMEDFFRKEYANRRERISNKDNANIIENDPLKIMPSPSHSTGGSHAEDEDEDEKKRKRKKKAEQETPNRKRGLGM
jgi:hypothetical protein